MASEEVRRRGAFIAITASDSRALINIMMTSVRNIKGNYDSDEARTFCDFSSKESIVSVARYPVTDGPRGSNIVLKGEAVYILPSPCVPLDTCGAGDACASGILYGTLRGIYDLRQMGRPAAKVASVVVSQQGTLLKVHDATKLAESFVFHYESSTIFSDVGSDQIPAYTLILLEL